MYGHIARDIVKIAVLCLKCRVRSTPTPSRLVAVQVGRALFSIGVGLAVIRSGLQGF